MKKTVAFAAVLACCALSAAAQEAAPAGWKLGFGFDERLRLESRNNYDFNDALDDSGGFAYQRAKVSAKAELPGKYELFAEGMDLRLANNDLIKPLQGDSLDLHQAYAVVKGEMFGLPLELKAGRQELKYGQGRLLAAPSWNNRIPHLDAAVLKYKKGGLSADAFWGARVSYDPNGWNDPNRHDILAGAYVSYRKSKDAPLLEGYFLSNYDDTNMSTLNRRTVGVHGQFMLPYSVACDIELPYQFGKSARKSVYASAMHLDLSREFKRDWSPRLALALNYATGDKKASDSVNNTFVPLYQSVHEPYGVTDLFRWQNMKEAALELSVKPQKDLKITAGTSYFWLTSVRDSWYDSAGKKLRTLRTTATASSYVGREASLTGKYDLGGGAGLEGGYARFFAGEYVKDTGAHDDTDFMYFQFSVKI